MVYSVKEADLVSVGFSEPDIATGIECQIKRSGAWGNTGSPLIPESTAGWCKLSNGIGCWLGEPDVAFPVGCDECRAGVAPRFWKVNPPK